MSEVADTGFKKPECGDLFTLGQITLLKDVLGGLIDIQAVGTDPDLVGPVTGAAMTEDYVPAAGNVNPDGTFFIVPETEGVFVVGFADGTEFTITAVQSAAYLGQPMPYRLLKVYATGTTGDFSVVY